MNNRLLLLSLALPVTALANGFNHFNSDGKVDVSISVLDCGRIEAREPSMFNPNVSDEHPLQSANSCYLIQHPKGTLLWDTGLNDGLNKLADGMEVMGGAFHFTLPITLNEQLTAMNIAPNDIDYLVLSHLHADHTGNANQFSSAKWLIQENEHQVAFDAEISAKIGFDLTQYQNLKDSVEVIKGDHQVFGDGSVVIVSAPGHTPGHQALYVDLPNYGPIVLSGDLYHSHQNRAQKAIPVFNQPEQTKASFARVEQLLIEKQAEIWIGHDIDEFNQKKLAPYRYQ
ncbi:N-acyl homoserine lactonase family protein [Vibrio fluminensis]|uniref:N-acyl homoserine lactonase family protein n=1 Tax=Vibrio fluminensis TaxID=2783614 RepID=UPI0018898801|nr:N-acyl homoserine lactonase family protein [Vibrio fluminensis]